MHQRRRSISPVRGLLFALSLPTAMLLAGDLVADGVTPIEITMLGPSATRIRVASGTTLPCDSGDNRRLIDGKFAPGQVLRASTPERCACFQQTYEPFSDSDWSPSGMVCRPQICTSIGRRKCVPAPDPTIRLQVRSQRPR